MIDLNKNPGIFFEHFFIAFLQLKQQLALVANLPHYFSAEMQLLPIGKYFLFHRSANSEVPVNDVAMKMNAPHVFYLSSPSF